MTEVEKKTLRSRIREVRRRAKGDRITLEEYAKTLLVTSEKDISNLRELSKEPEFHYSIWTTDEPGIHDVSSNFDQPGPVYGKLACLEPAVWIIPGEKSGNHYANRHEALLAMLGISD